MWRRAALILFLLCGCAWAEKPALEGVFPSGVSVASTNNITLFGKVDPWPPKIWSSGEGLTFNFETNKGKAQVIAAADAAPGARLIRLYGPEGASDPQILVVTAEAEILEQEPNDHFAHAQVLSGQSIHLNGRLGKNGDVDSFLLPMQAGEWLDASVDCYKLMGKLDPVLRLLTTNGFQLAWNHDFASLDPRLIWRSARDQSVVLQLFGFAYPANAEIQLSGGSGGSYRLHVTRTRSEPNRQEPCPAGNLTLGHPVGGSLGSAAKTQRYAITLTNGSWVDARVSVTEIGSKLDPWVSISDASGKELARNDDADGSRDARLEWQVPADGEYAIQVGSLTSHPRDGVDYMLELRELKPAFAATVTENAWAVAPGETNQLKISVKRWRGYTNELSFSIASLPDGVTSDSPKTDLKGGEVALSIVATTNAAPASVPIRIIARETPSGNERPVVFEFTNRTENNGVPGGYSTLLVETLDQPWLTVLEKRK